jgi:hypothetical protein
MRSSTFRGDCRKHGRAPLLSPVRRADLPWRLERFLLHWDDGYGELPLLIGTQTPLAVSQAWRNLDQESGRSSDRGSRSLAGWLEASRVQTRGT